MSKLKAVAKRDLRARWLWVLALALTAVAGPVQLPAHRRLAGSFPIDDTLMFNPCQESISAGNWLGNTIGSRWASIRFMRSGWRF